MTPGEAMTVIEGRRFAALVNLASNRKTFLRLAAQQPEVETLSHALPSDAAVLTEVSQRALALAAVGTEDERESEGDAALATYLWLLANHRRDLAEAAAGGVRDWRQFFWARKLADDLRLIGGSAGGNGSEAAVESTGKPTENVGPLYRKL